MRANHSSAERGLTWAAFAFALLANLAIAATWLGASATTSHAKNPELGGAAYFMTFGLIGIAFALFSWVTSIILVGINLIWNRAAFKSALGFITCIFNVPVLLYIGYAAFLIFGR